MSTLASEGAALGAGLKPSQLVEQTRELLAKPGAWIQRANAREKHGKAVSPSSPRATCWCLNGALVRQPAGREFYDALHDAWEALTGTRDFVGWNDATGRTQEEVICQLRLTAEWLRQRGI